MQDELRGGGRKVQIYIFICINIKNIGASISA
jgi:hypothetical protein